MVPRAGSRKARPGLNPGCAAVFEDTDAEIFFNVINDVKTQDVDGTELPNLDAARGEARKDIAEIKLSHFESLGGNWSSWTIEICDRDGALLLVVPFANN